MTRTKGDLEQVAARRRVAMAAEDAERLIDRLGIKTIPIDPIAIALTEHPLLYLCPGDYRNAFDGRLEYDPSPRRFFCYYNTKYDITGEHDHAPRTRFSLSHELGHFFIESHHDYLRTGGKLHSSAGEFMNNVLLERQADAFAARLLMPDRHFKPLVNQGELSIDILRGLAQSFRTSLVSTAIRAIECTHFYCAVSAIRDGDIAWTRCATPLIEEGIYPGERDRVPSRLGQTAWNAFRTGSSNTTTSAGWARDWFRIYDEDKVQSLPVLESYIPIRTMDTLLVLLTVPEEELLQDD